MYVGAAGLDDIARDYTTASWKLVAHRAQAPRDVSMSLARQVFKWRGRASMKAAPAAGVENIAREWDALPGDEIDKGSQLFNFHRARFHGAASIPAALGTWRLAPGQTRSLYKLRMMSARVMDGPRVQLDLVHRLNPGLAAVPFGNPSYNDAYRSMFGAQRVDLTPDRGQLDESRRIRRANASWEACASCVDDGNGDSLEQLVEDALANVVARGDVEEQMTVAYRFLKEHFGSSYDLNHSYSRTFANKVLHLSAMVDMSRKSDWV